jgi:hypothetical protein
LLVAVNLLAAGLVLPYARALDLLSVKAPDPVLVGAGDIARCGNSLDWATAKLVAGINGAVFTLGDNTYDVGSAAQYANCYGPTWGRFKSRTHPAVGNHDYMTTGASGYFGYFGTAAGPVGKGWYSYDLGAWHVVVLNSNCSDVGCTAGSEQEHWLRADLAANQLTALPAGQSRCTVAYWHHPLFSSDNQHGDDLSVRPLWDALYAYGADLVINGHAHDYERFGPQDSSGKADPYGIREFVAGTGGAVNYGFAVAKANSEMRNNDTRGVLKLTLHPGSYDWSFLPVAGQTFTDSGTASCHALPPPTTTTTTTTVPRPPVVRK